MRKTKKPKTTDNTPRNVNNLNGMTLKCTHGKDCPFEETYVVCLHVIEGAPVAYHKDPDISNVKAGKHPGGYAVCRNCLEAQDYTNVRLVCKDCAERYTYGNVN